MRSSLLRALLVAIALPLILAAAPNGNGVRIWQEEVTIPTYLTGDPDPNPLFYEGRTYQGAKGPIYPYPIVDKLTENKADKKYKSVFLENEYIKLSVLPELGGRIFSAVDKSNNYDFFYRQHVIKPALIGMLGAWISGGVEWNIPHHHRASSFMPVEYKLEEHPDGSKTIWVGELEIRHRMRWMMGLTLHPGKAYVEATMKLINRTPAVHSFLYFANVAVHTNPDYKIIFPPSTRVATQHSKSEFSRWPIGAGVYAGQDFTGVDVTLWKNHKQSISMFAHNSTEDFLAGYDYGKHAGTLHVAEHSIVNGKKFFTWGMGSAWDNMLTDADGPYLELMVGAYSDNQPDYSWVQPYEVKIAKQYWYPYQKIEGVKNANLDAAVNLDVSGSVAKLGFAVTAPHTAAKVKLTAGGKTVAERTVALDPGKPFYDAISLPGGVKETDLVATLESGGKELIRYQPREYKDEPLPERVERPKAPKDVATVEELYLTGLRLEQFYSPASEPDPYYEEALRRDPNDYNTNTALGILYYKRGRLADAEARLRTAVARATRNYTNPKDGEALYYLGMVLKARGKNQEAAEILGRATWSYAWHTASYYTLAEIAGLQQDYAKALEFLDRSLETNAINTRAMLLKSAMLRQLGRYDEAAQVAVAAGRIDPLDTWATRELQLAKSSNKAQPKPDSQIASNLDERVQVYLEMGVDYINAGLWDEGTKVLEALVGAYRDPANAYPMAYYYLAAIAEKQGNASRAQQMGKMASASKPDFCFPFRLESIEVLEGALRRNPSDARAAYYLGNLQFDSQPQLAMESWRKAVSLDSSLALAHRNLAWGYARATNEVDKAIPSLEKAIALKPDPLYLFELDRLYEFAGTQPAKRLEVFRKHQEVTELRDDALAREIRLLVETGDHTKAIQLLSNRRFNSWEGGARFSVHDSWVDAHLLRGLQAFKAGNTQDALRDLQASYQFPEKLSAAESVRSDKRAQVSYWMGVVYESMGRSVEAKKEFEQAASYTAQRRRRMWAPLDSAENLYYQGLALQKVGRDREAKEMFNRVETMGQQALRGENTVDYFAKFGERQSANARMAQGHFAIGLARLGSGEKEQARDSFQKALGLNLNYLEAAFQLRQLQNP